MKAFANRWWWPLVTVLCYLMLGWGSVLTPWLTQVGEEKFNRLTHNPMAHAFDLAALAVALGLSTAGTIRGLLNGDVQKAKQQS